MLIDPLTMSTSQVYFTMTQTVIPRPVAWVLTENENKSYNLAPYSYFNAVCSDPPLLMFSVGAQPDGSHKDTLNNVQARGKMVIHIASCDQLFELNQTSATLPPGVSEVDANNLALSAVAGFDLPRLSDCKVAFMCSRYKIDAIGDGQQRLVFAQIQFIYADDSCTETTQSGRLKVNSDRIEPLSRLGASRYASFGEVLEAKRPD